MSRTALLFSFIIFPLILFADGPRTVFKAHWGTEKLAVGLRQAPDANYGPQAFRVAGDTLRLLDGQNRRLLTYIKGVLINEFPAAPDSRDFSGRPEKQLTLLTSERIAFIQNSKFVDSIILKPDQVPQRLDEDYDGRVSLRLSSGTEFYVVQNNALQKKNSRLRLNHFNADEAQFIIPGGAQLDILSGDRPLASVQVQGQDAAGNYYIEVERFVNQVPLQIDRRIEVFDHQGKPLFICRLALNNYALIFRDISIDRKGNIYQMLQNAQGLEIVQWRHPDTSGKEQIILPAPAYDSGQEKEPQPQQELQQGLLKNGALQQVGPQQALDIADTYVQLNWTCTADNLTSGTITDGSGNHVHTPDWLSVGQNQRMPYKWGGFNTINGFLDGIAAGRYAGDSATDSVSPEAVGVDCSGFVSRCWKLDSHYSTRMMDDYITQPYDSWIDTKPGDACHKVGHVRMIVAHKADGTLDMVESAGFNWRVSYTNYSYAQLTSYTPRYYIYMDGTPGMIPRPTIEFMSAAQQAGLNWSVIEPDAIASYELEKSEDGYNYWQSETISNSATNYQTALADSSAIYFRMHAISAANGSAGLSSDTYGSMRVDGVARVLIVDGFDRISGSWNHVYHNFAVSYGRALEKLGIPFETAANESILDGSVALADYQSVIWFLGDESTVDETLNSNEQQLVKDYLKQGGRLFISGSEIAWDLDKEGFNADRTFFNDWLKADYVADDSDNYTVSGKPGTPFEGLTVHFDDGTHGVYSEDYPDVLSPLNGAQSALNYGSGTVAAVYFSGNFPGATKEGRLFYLGFPFETIYEPQERLSVMRAVMEFFDMLPATGIENGQVAPAVENFVLYQNYPNPFNPTTVVRYQLSTVSQVQLIVYNSLGQEVRTLVNRRQEAGSYSVEFDAAGLASGVYFYRLTTGQDVFTRRMLLVR